MSMNLPCGRCSVAHLPCGRCSVAHLPCVRCSVARLPCGRCSVAYFPYGRYSVARITFTHPRFLILKISSPTCDSPSRLAGPCPSIGAVIAAPRLRMSIASISVTLSEHCELSRFLSLEPLVAIQLLAHSSCVQTFCMREFLIAVQLGDLEVKPVIDLVEVVFWKLIHWKEVGVFALLRDVGTRRPGRYR